MWYSKWNRLAVAGSVWSVCDADSDLVLTTGGMRGRTPIITWALSHLPSHTYSTEVVWSDCRVVRLLMIDVSLQVTQFPPPHLRTAGQVESSKHRWLTLTTFLCQPSNLLPTYNLSNFLLPAKPGASCRIHQKFSVTQVCTAKKILPSVFLCDSPVIDPGPINKCNKLRFLSHWTNIIFEGKACIAMSGRRSTKGKQWVKMYCMHDTNVMWKKNCAKQQFWGLLVRNRETS